MNIVLYTMDFEPITVLDLPMWVLETLETRGRVRIAVMEPLSTITITSPSNSTPLPIVTIYLEKVLWRDGVKKSVLVTEDEELALVLCPEWLPGQRQVIQNYNQTIRSLQQAIVNALRK